MNKVYAFVGALAVVCACHSGAAQADAISDAQQLRSVYRGSFEVDFSNPVSFYIETLLPSQQVDLKFSTHPLGTTAFRALGIANSGFMPLFCDPHVDAGCNSAVLAPVTLHALSFMIDQCDVSNQIVNLCNSMNCLGNGQQMALPLQGVFTVENPIPLDQLSASCPNGHSVSFAEDGKHLIQFEEAMAQTPSGHNSGGRIDYEITVRNQSRTRKN